MSSLLNEKIKFWQEWITAEKRLSFISKVISKGFILFLFLKYINKPIELNDLECLDSDLLHHGL